MKTSVVLLMSLLQYCSAADWLYYGQSPYRAVCTKKSRSDNCPRRNDTQSDNYFYLFTRRNPVDPEYLHDCKRFLPTTTNFDPSQLTIIITHGFLEGICEEAWMREMKDQLLIRDDYNVIVAEWTWGNRFVISTAFENMLRAANQIAELIKNIEQQTGIGGEKFHVIGNSVGANLVINVGRRVEIRRVTAMEPVSPAYYNIDQNERRAPTKAKLVDVLHTNGGNCIPYIGDPNPYGTEDFYMNDGRTQLSCIPKTITSFLTGNFLYATASVVLPTLCSHLQVIEYYKASINPDGCQFVGVKCASAEDFLLGKCNRCGDDGSMCSVMGFDWEKYYQGSTNTSYYVHTAFKCPYCDNSKIDLGGFDVSP